MNGEFLGEGKLPRWFADGARVRVKSTKILRDYGLRTSAGAAAADSKAWPGDVGTVEAVQGNGWWDYWLVFDRGRRKRVDAETLEAVARVQPGKMKGLMGKLGKVCRSAGCASKQTWRTASGHVSTVKVPRACALVRVGGKKKVRKGCRLTKNGAVCDPVAVSRMPKTVDVRYGKTKKAALYEVRCK